jgi:ABC-type nitrate/sulfonate/bicarbonate transport system permease component
MLTQRTTTILLRIGAVAVALALWQAVTAGGVLDPDQFPTMTSTFAALLELVRTDGFWQAVRDTLSGWAMGMLIGSALAVVLGSILGLSRFAYRSVIPVIEFLKTVPVVAILPLAILLFGTSLRMKYFLVAFGILWPLTIQVIYGVRAVDPVVRDTAAALQLRGLRRFGLVTLPSAAPFVATGLRIAAATALILEIVTELIGGGAGLGLRILIVQNSGPTAFDTMYALIVVTGILGVLLTGVFAMLERRVLHWHESQRNIRTAAGDV